MDSLIAGPPLSLSARGGGLNLREQIVPAIITGCLAFGACLAPSLMGRILHDIGWAGFLAVTLWRIGALVSTRQSDPAPIVWAGRLPRYTLIAALKDEADVAPQLIRRLSRLNYPAGRLTGWLVVEPEDAATAAAIQACVKPAWLKLLVAPAGEPTTKPRALNVALNRIRSGLVTVYDAEDEPHPDQLLEAAVRFARDDPSLACLQAPLRVRTPARSSWLDRQFAGEYGALFEVVLPTLARLGLPAPLGGTSNHFRVDALRRVGGWDPWNVTEDADLGFRLHRFGYRFGVLDRPTWEPPPGPLRTWLPQRTRWLKGFMQTWSVHMRQPWALGVRGVIALQLVIGAAIVSASLQALVLAWIAACILAASFEGVVPLMPIHDIGLAGLGWATGAACCIVGAARAGAAYRLTDALTAPAYWSLLTLAQVHAAWRLIVQPSHWDKTPHTPDIHTPAEAAQQDLRIRARVAT